MSELSLVVPPQGGPGGPVDAVKDILRRVLVRLDGTVNPGTVIDINNPGPGWAVSGDEITFVDANEFQKRIVIYWNGNLTNLGLTGGSDDLYPVIDSTSNSKVILEFPLRKHEILQFMKHEKT
ncbi:MAG: hypothetical protein GF334_04720 [Candidatus Altiarchaeales archaeon]|nr:hypothetical protein [Candidatus Altiarchaeales archaeon]